MKYLFIAFLFSVAIVPIRDENGRVQALKIIDTDENNVCYQTATGSSIVCIPLDLDAPIRAVKKKLYRPHGSMYE